MNDTPTLTQKLTAEAVGTLVLVLLGCGVFAVNLQFHDAPVFATPLAFGFALVAVTFAFGRVSGGHFNPAVSVASGISGRLAWRDVAAYAGAQVAGGLVGGALLFAILSGFKTFDAEGAMGQGYFGDQGYGFSVWAALVVEIVLTALFVAIHLSATDARNEQRAFAPLSIGLVFAACYFFSLPLTGGGMNPARSIGPALFAGTDAILQLWLFILAPLVGAVLAGLAYPAVFGRGTDPVPGSGLNFARPAAAAVPGYGAPDQYQQQWNQEPGQQAGQQAVQQEERAWTIEEAAAQGWHWDAEAQQWRHVSETQAAPEEGWAPEQPAPQEWSDGGAGERTQIRPPDGQ